MMEKKQKQVPADLAEKQNNMPLTVANYKLMLIGLAIIIIGYVLMTGGGSDDPNVFNEEMFSFRRITLAPIVVLAGFGFEIYAIMYKSKNKNIISARKSAP